MYWADTTKGPTKYTDLINYYNNQALVWIHKLLHIDWVPTASSSGNIHHITDVKVGYKEGKTDILTYYKAYGPRICKALARLGWATGAWTIINADSLTLYAFAKYVQNALGNIYPHLPLAPPAQKARHFLSRSTTFSHSITTAPVNRPRTPPSTTSWSGV